VFFLFIEFYSSFSAFVKAPVVKLEPLTIDMLSASCRVFPVTALFIAPENHAIYFSPTLLASTVVTETFSISSHETSRVNITVSGPPGDLYV